MQATTDHIGFSHRIGCRTRSFPSCFPPVPTFRNACVLVATFAVTALCPAASQAVSSPSSAPAQLVSVQIEHGGGSARLAAQPVALHFEAFGQDVHLELEVNRGLLAPGVEAHVVDAGGRDTVGAPTTWIGRGEDGSEGRLLVQGSEVRGHVRTPQGTLVLEPSVPVSDSGILHTVRRAEDVLGASDPLACGLENQALAAVPADGGSARSVGETPLRILDLSVVADAQYYRSHGDHSVRDLVALFNGIDGIYRSQLGIAIQIVQLVVYRSEDVEPLSTSTSVGTLLFEISSARRDDAVLSLGAGALTHLVTGRTLDGKVRGMSWVGGVCHPFYGASLSSVVELSDYLATVVVAHEMGHSLGAFHDGTSGSGCEDTPSGFLMSPVLARNTAHEFSSCSRATIDSRLPEASCLQGLVDEACGNGVVDVGEECDPASEGSGGCCREDCRLRAAGLPCGDSGDVCQDAICDGAGACVLVPNEASCLPDDACVEGRCSSGTCVATDEVHEFDEAKARFRVDDDGMLNVVKLTVGAPIQPVGSDPSDGGLRFRMLLGNVVGWDEFVPGDRWVPKRRGKFLYRASSSVPGSIRMAKVRYDTRRGRATFRISTTRPMLAMPPTLPSIEVLAGDRIDGQCGEVHLSECTRKGGSYRCN